MGKRKSDLEIIRLMKEALPNIPIKITDEKGNIIYDETNQPKQPKKKIPVTSNP